MVTGLMRWLCCKRYNGLRFQKALKKISLYIIPCRVTCIVTWEMNKEVLSKYDVMSVAEGTGNTLEDAHNMVDANRHELNMAYPFEAVDIAKPEGYSLLHFKCSK